MSELSVKEKKALREAAENATQGKWCAMTDAKSDTYAVYTSGDKRRGDIINWTGFDGQKNAAANSKFIATANPSVVLALLAYVEKLEREKLAIEAAALAMRDDMRQARNELESIRDAAEKLVRCKGRYHSEQNYRALAKLFGVTTPDLPPLEHENVHYADAAEMEIAALRQRIAELESRRVRVELPPLEPDDSSDAQVAINAGIRNWAIVRCRDAFILACKQAGIECEVV